MANSTSKMFKADYSCRIGGCTDLVSVVYVSLLEHLSFSTYRVINTIMSKIGTILDATNVLQ